MINKNNDKKKYLSLYFVLITLKMIHLEIILYLQIQQNINKLTISYPLKLTIQIINMYFPFFVLMAENEGLHKNQALSHAGTPRSLTCAEVSEKNIELIPRKVCH